MDALIIFIKNPELGKVKTRIAKTAGDEKALAIYKELMRHTQKVSLGVEANRHLLYSENINFQDNWSNETFQKYLQPNTDLGGRMNHAFKNAFEENEKVIIIGSDCASLTTEIVQEAFEALEENDFVVGPTYDGGYYLLGMKRYSPTVFEEIEWSTETVFEKTIGKINSLKSKYFLMPILSDIDYEEDWEKYGWQIKS